MRTSVRMNISVSVTLKNKMDLFEREEETNWSRVAQKAFEKYIRKHGKQEKKEYTFDLPVYEKLEDIPRAMIEDILREHGYTLIDRKES